MRLMHLIYLCDLLSHVRVKLELEVFGVEVVLIFDVDAGFALHGKGAFELVKGERHVALHGHLVLVL